MEEILINRTNFDIYFTLLGSIWCYFTGCNCIYFICKSSKILGRFYHWFYIFISIQFMQQFMESFFLDEQLQNFHYLGGFVSFNRCVFCKKNLNIYVHFSDYTYFMLPSNSNFVFSFTKEVCFIILLKIIIHLRKQILIMKKFIFLHQMEKN